MKKIKKLSREKQEWLQEIGAKEFKEPMKYSVGGNWLYSEEYIKNTPLEELKARYDMQLIKKGVRRVERKKEGLRERMFYWDLKFRAKHPNLAIYFSVITLIISCLILLFAMKLSRL